jgi:hypothetical protein
MVIWMLFGSLTATVGALTAFVMWRDHRRSASGDRAATGMALAEAERQNAERQGSQGANWQREEFEGP